MPTIHTAWRWRLWRFRSGQARRADSRHRWSLRGGRHLTDLLQWEGQVTRGRVETTPLPGAERSVILTLALVNLVLNFHPRAEVVVPYVLLGVGLAKTKIQAVGLSSSDTETGYQIGGGGRFFLGRTSAVALRVELAIPGGDAFEHSYFHPSIGAGLTFRIGRHAAPNILRNQHVKMRLNFGIEVALDSLFVEKTDQPRSKCTQPLHLMTLPRRPVGAS